jgi:hypothetical protein
MRLPINCAVERGSKLRSLSRLNAVKLSDLSEGGSGYLGICFTVMLSCMNIQIYRLVVAIPDWSFGNNSPASPQHARSRAHFPSKSARKPRSPKTRKSEREGIYTVWYSHLRGDCVFIQPSLLLLIGITMKGPIAIIGAGPCGLTLARLLWRKNISFIVYEREASPAALAVSGSLDIRKETGQRALREAGLYKAFVEHARWEDDRVTFFDKSGNALHSNVGENEVGEDGIMAGGEPEIDRKALRNILLGSIPQDKILWGRRLTSISFSDNTKRSPILNFANGDAVGGFPLIVGTDGAWSRVRAAVCARQSTRDGTRTD